MNTFHVSPCSYLATEAAPEVRKILEEKGNVLVAIQGATAFAYTEEDGQEVYQDQLYSVCEAPADCTENGGQTEYMWQYVSAKEWLDAM
jgi:hypothetical protein